MSRIVPISLLLSFVMPVADDVTWFNLYYRDVNANPSSDPLNYNDPSKYVEQGLVDVTTDDEGVRHGQIDISNIDWSMGGLPNDSNILFGLSSVDDVGNESDIVALGEAVPFDQEAPDAPSNLELVR